MGEAAELLRVRPVTLRHWIAKGRVPAVQLGGPGTAVRIDPDEPARPAERRLGSHNPGQACQMLRACRRCGRPTTGAFCAEHQHLATRRHYNSGEYRANRQHLLATESTCWICGDGPRAGDPWTADHLIPLASNGTNARDNLRLAHHSCNSRRGAKRGEGYLRDRRTPPEYPANFPRVRGTLSTGAPENPRSRGGARPGAGRPRRRLGELVRAGTFVWNRPLHRRLLLEDDDLGIPEGDPWFPQLWDLQQAYRLQHPAADRGTLSALAQSFEATVGSYRGRLS